MEPGQRIDVVAKNIFSKLLLIIESSEAGVRENHEVESLHDFRVALRRTRALLHRLKGVFPKATIKRFNREFDWIRSVLGPARDLDVHLHSFDNFTSCLPKNRQKYLTSLFIVLHQERQEEQLRVIKILDSRRYRKIIDDWKKFVNKPVPLKTSLIDSNRAVILVANENIWHLYIQILNKGKRIKSGSQASKLHELRKKCKNLRYLIEFFQDMYPHKMIQILLDDLKNLQNNLGEFQDLHVQQCLLKRYSIKLKQKGDIDKEVIESMQILINKLEKRGQKAREKFNSKFKRFSSSENYKLYNNLCPGQN